MDMNLPLSQTELLSVALAGLALMLAEAFLPTFGFLGVAGCAIFLWAAYVLYMAGALPGFLVALGIAAIAIFALCAAMTWKAYRHKTTTGAESLIGSRAKVVEWKGTQGRIAIQGGNWQAESERVLDLKHGEEVIITAIDNLVLRVVPVQDI